MMEETGWIDISSALCDSLRLNFPGNAGQVLTKTTWKIVFDWDISILQP